MYPYVSFVEFKMQLGKYLGKKQFRHSYVKLHIHTIRQCWQYNTGVLQLGHSFEIKLRKYNVFIQFWIKEQLTKMIKYNNPGLSVYLCSQ